MLPSAVMPGTRTNTGTRTPLSSTDPLPALIPKFEFVLESSPPLSPVNITTVESATSVLFRVAYKCPMLSSRLSIIAA